MMKYNRGVVVNYLSRAFDERSQQNNLLREYISTIRDCPFGVVLANFSNAINAGLV